MNWRSPTSGEVPEGWTTTDTSDKWWRDPKIVGVVVIGIVVMVVVGVSVDTAAPTTPAPVVTRAPQEVPPLQAPDCPTVDLAVAQQVNDALVDDYVLGLAMSDGEWLVGSIYRPSDGERISSIDTWAVVAGQLYAISGSANEHSNLPDGRDIRPDAFSDDARQALDDCAFTAITGQKP